jgi:addiction module HigA family antidote
VAAGLSAGADDPAPAGIGAVEALAVASRVGNMRADPVNPLQETERYAGGAGARVRRRLQGQHAVIEFLQRIHGQDRASDVAALGVSQRGFARRLGWTPRKLNEIIKGKRNITAATAIDLAQALDTTPEFWLNLQQAWDLSQAYRLRRVS